jgi:hypothetical protein
VPGDAVPPPAGTRLAVTPRSIVEFDAP